MARDVDAVRITTAAASRNDDISRRQRRYVASMAVRTACFIGAILVGPGWLRWVLVAGALLLPYIAVVMANTVSSKSDGFALIGTPDGRHELAPGTRPSSGPDDR